MAEIDVTVGDGLAPGHRQTLPVLADDDEYPICVCVADHPRGLGWKLVVWRSIEGTQVTDCLSARQRLKVSFDDLDQRTRNLLTVLGEEGSTLAGALHWPGGED